MSHSVKVITNKNLKKKKTTTNEITCIERGGTTKQTNFISVKLFSLEIAHKVRQHKKHTNKRQRSAIRQVRARAQNENGTHYSCRIFSVANENKAKVNNVVSCFFNALDKFE